MPPPEPAATWSFEAIGTAWQVDTARPVAASERAAVLACVEDFDRTWSRFRDDSVVSALARDGGTHDLGATAGPLLALYDELHALTEGAVNPLVGRTLSDLGYDAAYALRRAEQVSPVPPWSMFARAGTTVTADRPVLLDVGAAGKGHLVDLVTARLLGAGHADVTVDAGGDLLSVGGPELRVALEDPRDPTRAVGVVELAPGRALCASAVNRRAWGEGLHHVLDARTGAPTTDVVATWVLADSCLLADGLATALFFADADAVMARFDVAWARMRADGTMSWSADLPGEVFT